MLAGRRAADTTAAELCSRARVGLPLHPAARLGFHPAASVKFAPIPDRAGFTASLPYIPVARSTGALLGSLVGFHLCHFDATMKHLTFFNFLIHF